MLANIFSDVLNMSLTASIVILAVCLARVALKKTPKIYSYLLWSLVLFRLLCPVSVLSSFSLIPAGISTGEVISNWEDDYVGAVHVLHDNRAEYTAAVEAGRIPVSAEEGYYYVVTGDDRISEPATVENTVMPRLAVVWLIGMAAMGIYSAISYARIRKQTAVAVPFRKHIFIADDVDSPFVMGILRPVIYLPAALEGKERKYIIAHERHHIRRGDHIFKALGFLALTVHWFNPLVWLAFVLAGRDMEMSCDEAVIRKYGPEIRADYSASLLNLATGHRLFAGTPLAFGEGNPTGRVRNLANWKKPAFWVVLICVVLCIALAICLLTNPKNADYSETITVTDIPTDRVTTVQLKNMHNGENTVILEQDAINAICDFLKNLSGNYLGSGKGYYEGTYSVTLLQDEEELFSIGFGDSNTFYYGEGDDGYPERYEPVNMDIGQIVAFLSQYDTSDFQWAFLEETEPSADDWGISIQPDRVSRTGATALFVYNVPDEERMELTYGDFLSLERLVDGEWVPVDELAGYDYFVGDSSYPVHDGYGMVHEWPDRFGELADGHYRMGKLVTNAAHEERMIYGEFTIPDSILTGPIPLADLPENYSAEQAMIDGCFVAEDGVARENKELFQDFAVCSQNGMPGVIRLVNWHYGEDSHWSAMDLRFDGNVYTLSSVENTYTYKYLKRFTGEKAWEGAEHDAFECYVLVNDETVTWEDIYSGKLDTGNSENPAHWTVYADYIYYPKRPQLPANPGEAVLEFEGEPLVTVTDFDRLEKLWILFSEAELLGYEPKTHSVGVDLHLILKSQSGETMTIELDPDSDICRIDGEFVFYGAFDEPDYIEKLWYYLDISAWPDEVYDMYPNAYRP